MLGEMRQQKILELLYRQKFVRISDLREKFHVSDETLRRDLKKLDSKSMLKRTHGGAVVSEEVHMVPAHAFHSQQFLTHKQQIAVRASSFVQENGNVLLDSGSTTLEIARQLSTRTVTVLMNDINFAMELTQCLSVNSLYSAVCTKSAVIHSLVSIVLRKSQTTTLTWRFLVQAV